MNQAGSAHLLYNGTTIHGAQFIEASQKNEPLTYFYPKGPIGDIFSIYNSSNLKPEVAIIGLGAGSVAFYATPKDHFVFYEIDPVVKEVASNTRFFSFLSNIKGSYEIVLGDGRLTLANAPGSHYGLIIVDAFSSDAIPIHLITKEALQLYLSKLEPNGTLVFHISNKFFDLEPLLGKLASELDLVCMAKRDFNISEEDWKATLQTPSHYVILSRCGSTIQQFSDRGNWNIVSAQPNAPIWTDQYSNPMSFLKW
ncbi:MAG: spermidine synthase [Syntrophobacteraceae bacterium]